MAVLGREEIKKQISKLFEEGTFDPDMIGLASYDLRLGEIAIIDGESTTKKDDDFIELPKNKLSLISSKEIFKFPKNICGRVGITLSSSKKGLIPLFGPQIDPCYKGPFWGLVFNMSDNDIKLTVGKKNFKFEFNEVNVNSGPEDKKSLNCKSNHPLEDIESWHTGDNFFQDLEERLERNSQEITQKEDALKKLAAKINSVADGYHTVTMFGIFLIATTILGISAASILTILFSEGMPNINRDYSTAVILGFLALLFYIFREVFKSLREIKEQSRK